MSESDRHPRLPPPLGKLEEWLQLPDDYVSDSAGEDSQPPSEQPPEHGETETASSDSSVSPDESDMGQEESIDEPPRQVKDQPDDALTLFPLPGSERESGAKRPVAEAAEVEADSIESTDPRVSYDKSPGAGELERMEALLAVEFRDTLTGPNALTLPIGLILIILALIGWFLRPLLSYMGMGTAGVEFGYVPVVIATVLALAGIHLIFYWLVHWVSNLVKSREMDSLIRRRRVERPCAHLDCYERPPDMDSAEVSESEDSVVDSDLDADGIEPEDVELAWRCALYDVDLEEIPICVVCPNYEPSDPPESRIGFG